MARKYVRRFGIVPPLTRLPAGVVLRPVAYCKHGHPFTAENTRWTKSGIRRCIACETHTLTRRST